jgi:hypothetical protein
MKLHRDHWRLRLMGVLFGIGCLALGLSGMVGGADGELDFSVIAIVTGLIATWGSITSSDIIGSWYCNPKRLAARRARETRA